MTRWVPTERGRHAWRRASFQPAADDSEVGRGVPFFVPVCVCVCVCVTVVRGETTTDESFVK